MKRKFIVFSILALGLVALGSAVKPAVACDGSCEDPSMTPPTAPKPEDPKS